MKTDYKHVLAPIQIGPMKLKNRVSFTPVWPSFATADGQVNQALIEWVRGIVEGGCACINIGCGTVNRDLPAFITHLLRMGEESVVNELSMLCDMTHMYNCKIGMELFAINLEAGGFEDRDKSATKPVVEIDPTYLTKQQIKDFIEDFANAAERAMRCGFDSLVIHGAHGQLPGCFLSKLINERTDEYGTQSMENRARFTNELLEAIRAKIGNKMAIEYRINANDMIEGSPTIEEVIECAQSISNKIDLLHVSRGMHSIQKLAPYINQPIYFDHGINIDDAAKIKAAINIPVTVVGSVTLEQADEAIKAGKIDMVSMARGLMADPYLVKNAKYGESEKTRPCIRCNNCIQKTHYQLAPVRCTVNAEMGMETLYQPIKEPKKLKRVAIIGGGAAGLEAARVAASRGHQVVIYEKGERLGGILNIAGAAEFKKDIKNYCEWSIREAQLMDGIEIKMGVEATPEMIKAQGYDTVLVSMGAVPIIPAFVHEDERSFWVGDVENGIATTGHEVLIIGAGLTGCETALAQSRKGKSVTLVDMISTDKFGSGGATFNQIAIINMLKNAGVKMLGGLKMLKTDERGAVFANETGDNVNIACDSMVVSFGVRANDELVDSYRGVAVEVVAIGDCNTRQGTLYNAVHTGHEAGYMI
ncbi:oxidoreductase [[Clostridium] fimetarium]|uniref:2,4-dienoyl-CoA reductase n=1 Tax=[Clostridium] fimetarium TaxID=99656 RepID=A0A1I0PF90_9FIRM|nr:FAD-dependent oxidoreductase [[Clostridium] fimetarium]SEW12914.1 2,4-dienoyl-CoA reductase [[Clostridium] fimetarium]